MDKKSQMSQTSAVAVLIFVLIVGFVLIRIMMEAAPTAEGLSGKALCQNSITFSSNDKNPEFSREGCIPGRVKLSKENYVDTDDNNLEELVKRDVADLMVGCWNMVGEGKLMPYKVNRARWSTCTSSEYVLICDIVEFEEIEPFNGLNLWMINHKPSTKLIGYFDYLYSDVSTEIVNKHKSVEDTYDTSREYAVVWVVAKNPNEDRLKEIIPVPIEKEWNGVLFVPYDEIIPTDTEGKYNLNDCVFVMN